MKLFYQTPTEKLKIKPNILSNRGENYWEQTVLPLGNGNLGLSVFGEAKQETIVVNHKTLWSGGPSAARPSYAGGNLFGADKNGKTRFDYFKEVRELMLRGEDSKASALCNKLVGTEDGYGNYQCWGEIKVLFSKNNAKVVSYSRSLDLDTATCKIIINDQMERSYFVSRPDNVAVLKFANAAEKFSCVISFPTRNACCQIADETGLLQSGTLADNGLNFASFTAITTDGAVSGANGELKVDNASYAELYLAADTDYYDNYPVYRTGESAENLKSRVTSVAITAKQKGYASVFQAHVADYRKLYDRVQLNLGGNTAEVPTDALLKSYPKAWCKKEHRRQLEELLYQYGRYLTIASSRAEDLLPSNLQGIWNASDHPAWNCDFHLNVNLQMNYWPTYSANLAECAKPLLRYVEKLRAPGRVTAEVYSGVKSAAGEENGFMFHTQNTPFGWTCPGWDFSWGWSPAAVCWILHNVYEYYEYTADAVTLKNEIYPMLKEASDYFIGLLAEDKTGRLVTAPCFSPEHGPRTLGNTYEQALVAQMLMDAADAAAALNVDAEKRKRWEETLLRLHPIEIGDSGQVKEWYHETTLGKIGQKHHRHMSHLLALYPLNVIDKFKNPDELQASVVSMNDRGDKSVGWAMGQRINTRARTGDGDRCLKLIKELFKRGIHLNLFDVHPPFQIDGNFGFTAGVNEMLMQSNLGCIELLPALPADWKTGSIRGIVARGNVTLSIEWENGLLRRAEAVANVGGELKFCCPQGKLKADCASGYTERDWLLITAAPGQKFTLTLA